MYGMCLSRYEASAQGDPDSFVHFATGKSYILYAYFFLQKYPALQPLATKALQTNSQREEGVEDGIAPENSSGKRRKRQREEIGIAELGTLSSIFRPASKTAARETEEAEREKAK